MTAGLLAALPMYDRAETAAANDTLWRAIREALGFGPEELCRDRDPRDIWNSPDLLLAQTCGLPYRAALATKVTLVATPDYGLPGCPPGYYNSVLVVRADEESNHISGFEGRRLAYNDALSQSGWAAPMTYSAYYDVAFGAFVHTGAHRASAQAVAEGSADIAAIDAQSWQLMQRYDGFTGTLRELDSTRPTPALPFVTARGRDPAPLLAALDEAVAEIDDNTRETLGLQGILSFPAEAYLSQPVPELPPESG